MNGIDTKEWNPATDPYLPPSGRFDLETMATGKAAMKAKVQQRLGLDKNPNAALAVFIGRLTEQKGLDVLLNAVPGILSGLPTPAPKPAPHPALLPALLEEESRQNNTDYPRDLEETQAAQEECSFSPDASSGKQEKKVLQLAMLGTGDKWMEAALGGLERSYPGQAVGIIAFSEELAHWLLAAADYVLVPSRFEPCGLIAQCGARYGAVPIVTAVGGLKDLVQPGVGYALQPLGPAGDTQAQRADVQRLAQALRVAAREAGTENHRGMQRRSMELELSWTKPAEEWEEVLYRVATMRRSSGK